MQKGERHDHPASGSTNWGTVVPLYHPCLKQYDLPSLKIYPLIFSTGAHRREREWHAIGRYLFIYMLLFLHQQNQGFSLTHILFTTVPVQETI